MEGHRCGVCRHRLDRLRVGPRRLHQAPPDEEERQGPPSGVALGVRHRGLRLPVALPLRLAERPKAEEGAQGSPQAPPRHAVDVHGPVLVTLLSGSGPST
jgi:hypothetical protein